MRSVLIKDTTRAQREEIVRRALCDGGCQGCGMADVTLKQGIEKTLMEKVPGVTAVRDATDHDTGAAPFIPRDGAGSESGTSPLGAA